MCHNIKTEPHPKIFEVGDQELIDWPATLQSRSVIARMERLELEKYQGTSHVSLDTMDNEYDGHNKMPTLSGLGKLFGETIAKYIRIIIVAIVLIIVILVVVKFRHHCTNCRTRAPVQEQSRAISINIPPIEARHPYERIQQENMAMTSLSRTASSSDILHGEVREEHLDSNQDDSTAYVTMEDNLPGGSQNSELRDERTSGRLEPEKRIKKYVKFATSIKSRNSSH